MTPLQKLPPPFLVVAPDGWVSFVRDRAALERWNRRAVANYSRIGFLVVDGAGAAWRLASLGWREDQSAGARLLARLLGRPLPSEVLFQPVDHPLEAAKRALREALAADDDLLTQFTDADEIGREVDVAASVAELIAALKRLGVVD